MTSPRTPLRLRFLAVGMAIVLLFALVLLVVRRNADEAPTPEPSGPAAVQDPATPQQSRPPGDDPSTLGAEQALQLLSDVDAATDAGAEQVQEAAARAVAGPWADLDPSGVVTAEDARRRPVYVARAVVDATRRSVEAAVAIAVPADADRAPVLTLRFLAGADAVVEAGSLPTVQALVDGEPAEVEIDTAGARLRLRHDRFADPDAPPALVRLDLAYEVPDRRAIIDDGGPAGFGLLAYNPDVTILGHFLPLLTFEDGPMLPYGDVGSFPAATWSVRLESGGVVVTSGDETEPCPPPAGACVWARGVGLRDVAVAVFDEDVTTVTDGRVRVTGAARTVSDEVGAQLAAEAVASGELFTELFGEIAWPDVEVVVAPLTAGAAGMEFPGLVILRTDTVASLRGGFGTYVTVHEMAHQWFHAFLGNGSLGAPVVDESLAQYASVVFYADEYGDGAARDLLDRYYTARYLRWRDTGAADVAPGEPLASFGDSGTYGPMVYARGALAWVAAEQAVGRAAVLDLVTGLVDAHPLGEVSVADVAAAADVDAPGAGAVLRRWWLDPTPLAADELP